MVGVLLHQDLGDQRLGGQAAFDDPGGRRRLDDGTLAGTATIVRPTCHQHAERGRHHVEVLGDILADPLLARLRLGSSRGCGTRLCSGLI